MEKQTGANILIEISYKNKAKQLLGSIFGHKLHETIFCFVGGGGGVVSSGQELFLFSTDKKRFVCPFSHSTLWSVFWLTPSYLWLGMKTKSCFAQICRLETCGPPHSVKILVVKWGEKGFSFVWTWWSGGGSGSFHRIQWDHKSLDTSRQMVQALSYLSNCLYICFVVFFPLKAFCLPVYHVKLWT